MKNLLILGTLVFLLFSSCTKKVETTGLIEHPPYNEFVKYTISKGLQSSDKNPYTAVEYEHLKFVARFDSSAIYQTIIPTNQKDVNKLFGFSDNNATHHEYSARFGWRWSNNALRIFAYVYNKGIVSIKELGTAGIGVDVHCSIKILPAEYIFTLNDKVETMARTSITPRAKGYKLYPYFGGDEMAPHTISIWIKEVR